MPRKAYLADLSLASESNGFGNNIHSVRPGSDDGEFLFSFNFASNRSPVDISALVPDVSEYPNRHEYHIFASDDAPASLAIALQQTPNLQGKPIAMALGTLSRFLADRTRTGGQADPLEIDSDSDIGMPDSHFDIDADDDLDMNGDNEDWALDDALSGGSSIIRPFHHSETVQLGSDHDYLSRARADLRTAKAAGFKVGILGSLQPGSGGFVSISCRIAKLGISEEAMAAWSIKPEEYLILLINYKSGYKPLDFLQLLEIFGARNHIEMRTGLCNSYKPPTITDAYQAFKVMASDVYDSDEHVEQHDDATGFHQSFISRPLDELLNGRLLTIIKYRLSMGLGWVGAELYFNESQGQRKANSDYVDHKYLVADDVSSALPLLVRGDEVTSKSAHQVSFPLVAMQFLLRHFVLAPQFCLVCHCKLKDQLEAIKPYVCDNGLCLYQYMSLGFGPEIEHELKSQPYVVDLLVSFCYSSIRCQSLHSFPEGLSLQVPHPMRPFEEWVAFTSANAMSAARFMHGPPSPASASKPNHKSSENVQCNIYAGKIDQEKRELLFNLTEFKRCPLRKGDWIVINCDGSPAWHCRIMDTSFFPSVTVAEPLIVDTDKKAGRPVRLITETVRKAGWQTVKVHTYDQNFDELSEDSKYRAMELMLDLLPSVTEMRDYLVKTPGASLAKWNDRICPATLGIFRWIIASNRSCIMQVDQPEFLGRGLVAEERVQGVPDFLQFRFAMGAPDKERRFVDAIKAEKHLSEYPTLFAWHGSNLANWHNIIRESLNFNKTTNGRAYGDGVYFAKEVQTSIGYSGMHRFNGIGDGNSGAYGGSWPQSILQISAALAMAEIVNAPDKFVSQQPYYVVAQLEWIQTRYLFVKPIATVTIPDTVVTKVLPQDPTRTPKGSSMKEVILPVTAIPKSRRPVSRSGTASLPKKRSKLTMKAMSLFDGKASKIALETDASSILTDMADIELLREPAPQPLAPVATIKAKVKQAITTTATPFKITTLNGLPTMPPPSYATSTATKRLQKDFRTLLVTQESHIASNTLPDLGWYVDPDHVSRTDNLYQWVVELHSFPLCLPLAIDMQAQSIQSVVLEIRFHATYPMSPPFVRVVRPRFLPFMSGGGGHITAGGSICMDLLTNSGWTVVSDIESVLLQIRMAIMSTDPRPARLDGGSRGSAGSVDYGVGEAVEAFKRACMAHGWAVPDGLSEITFGR